MSNLSLRFAARRFTSRFALLAALSMGVVACADDGAVGPAGPAGDKGDPGDKGDKGDPGEDGTGTASVSGVAPGEVFLERTTDVYISGNGTAWTSAATVSFGAGVTVDDVLVASPTAIRATVTIGAGATLGAHDVTVTEGGATVTYAGAFEVSEPISAVVLGTKAQGSILIGRVDLNDLSTPFDTSNDLALLGIGLGDGALATPDAATPYNIDSVLFVDVLQPAGAVDVVVESGIDPITSRAVDGVDVEARTPTALTLGTDAAGTLAAAFDTAVYKIDVAANTLATLDLTTTTMGAAPFMVLLDSSGSFANILDVNESLTLPTDDVAASYYVVVWDNTGAAAVAYSIESQGVTLVSETEPNDTSATANAVTLPAAISASIGTGTDADFFSFTATAGTSVTATVSGGGADVCGPAGDIDSFIQIRDTNGTTVLASNDDIDGFGNFCSTSTFAITTTGTYFVRVNNSTFSPTATYDYTLSISAQ